LTSEAALFGRLYGTLDMRAVFSEERRLRAMLDFEVALARVQAALGIVPVTAANAIAAAAQVDALDRVAIVRGTENVGYPVVPLTKELVRLAGPEAGAYVHWGATTQDVMDTSLVLQLRDAFALLEDDLAGLVRALAERAELHRSDVVAGRTHLQHALPMTFGYKCAVWLAPLCEALVSLRSAREAALVVQFGGAVGTLASLGDRGRAVTLALAQELGLAAPDAPWHSDRSRLAASATAPWQSEEIALPQIFVLASAAFSQARAIAEGMTVDVKRMRANVDVTHGLIVSEAVAMALAERMGKAEAHHAVERACATVLAGGGDLASVLAADPVVGNVFDAARLATLLDPSAYVGESEAVVDRVLRRAENVLNAQVVSRI
jgi:adenylosuccinate lyase